MCTIWSTWRGRRLWGGAFAIVVLACSGTEPILPTGSVRVTTATAGTDLDPDGYTVTLDEGQPQPVAVNGAVLLTGLTSGAHALALGGVAANCIPNDANASALNVVAGDTADVAFTVTCTSTFASVSVGYLFACGITIAGGTYCWGINQDGQLGHGATGPAECFGYPCSIIPVSVVGGLRFVVLHTKGAKSGKGYKGGGNLVFNLKNGGVGLGKISKKAKLKKAHGAPRMIIRIARHPVVPHHEVQVTALTVTFSGIGQPQRITAPAHAIAQYGRG